MYKTKIICLILIISFILPACQYKFPRLPEVHLKTLEGYVSYLDTAPQYVPIDVNWWSIQVWIYGGDGVMLEIPSVIPANYRYAYYLAVNGTNDIFLINCYGYHYKINVIY